MSGGLADAGEGLGERGAGEAEGAGLAAAAEGLALLECEEALPSEEPAGALRGACGAALPSPQAKPKRQLGWKARSWQGSRNDWCSPQHESTLCMCMYRALSVAAL